MDKAEIEKYVFSYRGDNIDFATALKVGIVKEDEYGRFWLKLTNTQALDIIDAEKITEETSCQTDTSKLQN